MADARVSGAEGGDGAKAPGPESGAAKAGVATGPEKPPDPKKVVRRAQELVREASYLVRKRKKKVAEAGVAEVTGHLERLVALLGDKKAALAQSRDVLRVSIELDQSLTKYFGRWRKSQLRELVEAILWAVGLAIFIRCFLIEAFSIPSASMYPTLEIGDHLFINKISYGLYVPFSPKRMVEWSQPERGDIIVFEYRYPDPDGPSPLVTPSYQRDEMDGEDFIKRVIALPGDHVRLEGDRIILNGQPIQTEPLGTFQCPKLVADNDRRPGGYCTCDKQRETIGDASWVSQHFTGAECSPFGPNDRWPLDHWTTLPYLGEKGRNPDWPDVVVPPGHVFVMGDNRDASKDGRFWGFVPFNRIKGKAFVIWLNWGDMSRFGNWLD